MGYPDTDQRGMALPMVLVIITCIIIVALSFLAMFQARTRLNTAYANVNDAGYIAEAGLSNYLWELNRDNNFYKTHTTYAGKYEDGYYYISVQSTGAPLKLECIGWLANDPDKKYAFQAELAKREFCQYVYCSKHESSVPKTGVFDPKENYVWWVGRDTLHGKLHTNGIIHTSGAPTFTDVVSYAGLDATSYDNSTNPPTPKNDITYNPGPVFQKGPPIWVSELGWPTSNSETERRAKHGGYYFNGRTCINLKGDKMDIVTWDSDTQSFKTYNNYDLPSNRVIYVHGQQDSADTNNKLNYDSSIQDTQERDKFTLAKGNVFVSGTLDGQLTIGANNNIYITAGDPTGPPPTTTPVASGGVTYATTTFDPITGEVTNLGNNDMLGLVTDNYIQILRYGWPKQYGSISDTYYNLDEYAPTDVYIDAALFSIKYSFMYEGHWNISNPHNKIHLHGSIIQSYRGIVGRFNESNPNQLSCGYFKDYWHDPRMDLETPPHFLEPTTSGWGILSWKKISTPPTTLKQATGIDITGETLASVGRTLQLQATVQPADATMQTVKWKLANYNGAQATINTNSGLLTAGPTEGYVVVTAMAMDGSNVSASTTIDIVNVPVTGIVVTGAAILAVNNTLQLQATVQPEYASNQVLQWSATNSGGAAAIIDPHTGLLTAGASPGSVNVTAMATDGSGVSSFPPTIINIYVPLQSFTVTNQENKTSVKKGSTPLHMQISNKNPSNASIKSIVWSCINQNGAQASIDPDTGILTVGNSAGKVTVTAEVTDMGETKKSNTTTITITSH